MIELENNKCDKCGKSLRKKAPDYSKLEMAEKLVKLMNWPKHSVFEIRNNSLRTSQIEEICNKLENK